MNLEFKNKAQNKTHKICIIKNSAASLSYPKNSQPPKKRTKLRKRVENNIFSCKSTFQFLTILFLSVIRILLEAQERNQGVYALSNDLPFSRAQKMPKRKREK